VPLSLSQTHSDALKSVEFELRAGAEAIGAALAPRIADLAPALAPPAGEPVREPAGELQELGLDHEGEPDALSLSACLAAHRAYVGRRGRPEALSTGALALARLLVWAHRAALLGSPPEMAWIGPAPRLPEPGSGQIVLRARCAIATPQGIRRAEAAALLQSPEPPSPQAD
jgi:hypothetical protein